MPEKKAAVKREAKRTFESPLEAPLSLRLVPQARAIEGQEQPGEPDSLPVETPEAAVLARLIKRIKGL